MFIGEAAGYHELKQRRPFVGAAGLLLNRALTEVGLKRETVFIANLLKCRPPGNRDPRPEEIAAYRPYLDQEIEVIRPQIIATLGRYSLAKFLDNQVKISQVHGQPRWVNFPLKNHPDYRVVVLPMYHPAAALRSASVKSIFLKDFKKLPQILERLNDEHDKIKKQIPKPKPKKQGKNSTQLSLI